jgi:hypothetical protein
MVTMLDAAHAADGSADREQWCIDNWAAVCAHIGATARLTSGTASGFLLVGTALRDRFPKVQALFLAGVISYPLVKAIVTRSMLVTDPEARRALDTALADALATWEPMSVEKTEQAIDALIEQVDPHAVRRTQTQARSRSVDISVDDGSGLAQLFATLFAPDATALDSRLNALADTACPADPRTKDQRRSDAIGALSHGADRLMCLCDATDCPAGEIPPSTGVVIYIVAHQDTITGPAQPPPNSPHDPNGPQDPDSPDAPDDSPVPDDANDSADPADPSTPGDVDDPNDHDGQAVTDEAGSADGSGHSGEPDRAACDRTANNHTASDSAAAECAGLDGHPPPLFSKPLRELTWADFAHPDPGPPACIRPAAMMGGQFIPGAITRRAALNATLTAIIHPGQAPPESHYTPSKKLAEFVRCRDLTCRFPGCKEPATNCDVDHAIPWPYGPTQAANLRCLCRKHHLLKTFWAGEGGWRDRQLPDGTVIWTAPDGRNHVTRPGSRLLFPELCQPTAPVIPVDVPAQPAHSAGLKMPRRKTTRAQDRARRIHDERELNKALIEAEAQQKVAAEAEAEAKAVAAAEQARAAAVAAEPPPPF